MLFHTANVLLLFVLLNKLTEATWRSAFIAAIFAVHPLQVDTVAWVTERKNVLSGLFWILTLLAYVAYVRRGGVGRYLLAILLFIAGLMCKPVLVALPGAMLLLDIWPLRRWTWARQRLPPASSQTGSIEKPPAKISFLILEKLPLILLAIGSSLLTVLSHEGLGISQQSHGLPFGLRLENAYASFVRYLGKFFWPARLAVLYPHPGRWPEAAVWGSFLLLAIITVLVVWNFRRRPFLAVGWFWFIGVLLPASGILQVGMQAMADRFAYLPIIGLLIAVTWTAAELIGRGQLKETVTWTAAGLLLAGCVALSSLQLRYWRNSFTLWEHAIQVTGPNPLAHNNLAYALYLDRRFDQALAHARNAARIRPDLGEPRLQIGMILEAQGKPEEAAAAYREALAIHSNWPLARKHLGDLLAKNDKPAEAIEQYLVFLQMVPRKTREAMEQYREVLRLNANEPTALNNLAWILATNPGAGIRNGQEAVELAQRACEVTGHKQALLLGTLAAAYAENGQFTEAVRSADEAISLARKAGLNDVAEANERLKKVYAERKTYLEGGMP